MPKFAFFLSGSQIELFLLLHPDIFKSYYQPPLELQQLFRLLT
ncbi:MAG TPA: hypothetical protein PKD56_08635 [Chitinophagales bacterium]|nr:hypothetical protein [Chitinophagales bacterium]